MMALMVPLTINDIIHDINDDITDNYGADGRKAGSEVKRFPEQLGCNSSS